MRESSVELDVGQWEKVGSTELADHYLPEPGVLITVYRPGSRDTERTAREQLRYQEEFIRGKGVPHGLVVLIDNLVSQDAASRRVYAKEPDRDVFVGVALVGGSMLSRGVASFFLGISRTAVPMKFFADVDGARAWLGELRRPRDARDE